MIVASSATESCDDLTGCFSDFCYVTSSRKTVQTMKQIIKRDKMIGEVRRIQHRLGFVSDNHGEIFT